LSKKLSAWRADNREKVKLDGRAYYAHTKEKRIRSVIEWQQRNPQSKRMFGAAYRANHKNALKEWRYKNRGLVYQHNDSREEMKRHATPIWLTKRDRLLIKTIYQMSNRLSKCTGIHHHVDHIHPLNAVGSCGLHVPWNLRAIPARLNLKKKNSLGGNEY
jgi:aromatic ring-cleaving dioxygenase